MVTQLEQSAQNERLADFWDQIGLSTVKDKAVKQIKEKSIEASIGWAAENPRKVRIASAFVIIMVLGAVSGALALGYTKGKA